MSTEIEVITYEKERLDYFTKLMQKARKRYKRLYEKHSNCGYMSPEYQLLCDAGRKAQFHEDVVKMLEKDYRKQEWISVDERLPSMDELCLLSMENRITKYRWVVIGYYHTNYDEYVTHWMPLPEPPMMKGGDK